SSACLRDSAVKKSMPPSPPSESAMPAGQGLDRTGLILLGIAVFSYAGLWPVMRVTVQFMPPFWFAVARLLLGSAALFVLLAVTGRLRIPTRQDMPAVITVGFFMMGVYVCLAHVALQYVGAGRGALLA